MKLTIEECTTLLEALDGPSVVSQKAAALYERVREERECLRTERNIKLHQRLQAKRDKENQKFAEGLTGDPLGYLARRK